MKQKIINDGWTISRPCSRIKRGDSQYGTWYDGKVITPLGYVTVYYEPGRVLSLRFIQSSYEHIREIEPGPKTVCGAVRMAAAFAREIAAQKGTP